MSAQQRICILVWLTSLAIYNSHLHAQQEEPILVIDPQGHSAITSEIMFTPDGATLISVSQDKTIRLWDVESGYLIKTIRGQIGDGSEGKLYAGALSPDGKTLAVAGYGFGDRFYVNLFNIESGEQIGLLKEHTGAIFALAFSKEGGLLASGGQDNTVKIWDVNSQKVLVTLEGHSDYVYSVAFSPDGKKLVSSSFDGTLRLWNVNTMDKVTYKEMKHHTAQVLSVAFAPNGIYIVSGGYDDKILLWDANGSLIKEIDTYTGAVTTISFSIDSKKICVGGITFSPINIYEIPSGERITTFSKHTNSIQASTFYNNDLVASASDNIYIWNANSGNVETEIIGKGRRVMAVAFGEGLDVAFGNSNPTGLLMDCPLEKSFNFSTMSLNAHPPDESTLQPPKIEYLGKQLEMIDRWTLKIENNQIKHDTLSDMGINCYTFTKNGNIVVGGHYSLSLYRRDGRIMTEFLGHIGSVWAVSVDKSGRILASASGDQTLKLWNIQSGELLATLFVTSDNEWICWTPQGYYAASAGGEKYIGWQINQGMDKTALYYPVSTFRQQYYKPEVVKRTIALGNFTQALAEINAQQRQKVKMQAVTEMLPPKVQWLTPSAYRSENSSSTVQLKAKLISDTKITEVRWLRNGRPFATKRAETFAAMTLPALGQYIEQEATLNEGQNEFAIFAANANASATSDKRLIIYKPPTQRNVRPVGTVTINDWEKPNLYMVSVGISAYQLNTLSLTYADDDARAMSQIFQAQQGKLYRTVNIKTLYDIEATRANILEALDWLEKSTTQKDVAIIFLAAHGVNDHKGYFYVLPSDGNPDKLRITSIDLGDFKKTLGDLPSRVLLFLDTCHSGQLGSSLYALRGIDNTEALRELSSDEFGVVIMAASTGAEQSMERAEWGHGAFTQALIEGLKEHKADYSGDGIIHLNELDTYVSERLKQLTNGKQHATTQKPSSISRFPIFQF